MGIFFDHDWFDDRLKASGLTRASMAQAAGMTIDEIEMVFSDRRELEGGEVHAIARILASDPREIADRAGASDPGEMAMSAPPPPLRGGPGMTVRAEAPVTREMIAGIHERLDRLESLVELVIRKLDQKR
jgi:hypothetical protein